MPQAQYSDPQAPRSPAIGVLIANTGTPDEADPGAVRRFLAEMLADPRLIELPRALWLPVLHGIVLRFRPRRSARAYAAVWTAEGSPLLVHAQRLRARLADRLAGQLRLPVRVELGMNYGRPAIRDALNRLREAGCTRILVLPLYPQYAAVVTASVFDRVAAELARWRELPELCFVRDYHDAPGYIEALADSIEGWWREHGRADHLLMSFHSMPRSYVDRGDPYLGQVQRSARLLAARLGLKPGQWSVSFQSRFGFQEWLRPYTDDAVAGLARAGVRRLAVVCPGFSVDCLESLEEVAIGLRGQFSRHGGETLEYIPALNDSAAHVDCLAGLLQQKLAGWLPETPASLPPRGTVTPISRLGHG